jgi:hypothetical protein
VILVDPEDEYLLECFGWCIDSHGYAVATINYSKHYLHRLIMNAVRTSLYVDHINGNKLDNRRSNLRLCTHRDNLNNRPRNKNNKSGYKGVYLHKVNKNWVARIQVNGKYISLGSYSDIIDAAKAYNEAAIKYFGEYAYLNKVN